MELDRAHFGLPNLSKHVLIVWNDLSYKKRVDELEDAVNLRPRKSSTYYKLQN